MRLRIHRYNDTDDNRASTSKELSAECLKVSEMLSEALSEECPQVSAECPQVSVRCLRVSEISKKTVTDMIFTGMLDPLRVTLNILPIAVVVSAGYLTMHNRDASFQVFMYLLGFGLFALFDTFRIMGRVLALQSRILLAVDLFALAIGCIKPNVKYFGLVAVWVVLSVLIIKLTNKACIQAHNWITAESVQNAVAKNPQSKAFSAWESKGKHQARIVLSECGLHFSDSVLDSYGMPLFLCGYYSAIQKNQKLKRSAEKAADMIDDVRYHNDDLTEHNQALRNQVEKLQAKIDRLTADNQIYSARLREAQAQQETRQNPVHEVPEDTDERIKNTLRNGASIRDAARICGVTKAKVEKIKSEIKEELSA